MKIYLGAHLNFYHPKKEKVLDVDLRQPTFLVDILEDVGIPLGEVQMLVINNKIVIYDEIAELLDAVIAPQDQIKLFPAVGGG